MTTSKSIRVSKTPFSRYIDNISEKDDVFNRLSKLYDIEISIKKNALSEDLEYIYNIVDMVESLLFEDVQNGVVTTQKDFDENFKFIIKYIESKDFFSKENILLDDAYDSIKQEEKLLKSGATGVRGIASCPRCKKDNIIIYSKQKSRGDEGEAIFYTCTDCNNKWFN